MSARKQEINLQLRQIIDGVLLMITFWLAFALRYYGAEWLNIERPIKPFDAFRWMIFIIIPFGPIILEMQGFYSYPLQKTLDKSLRQMLRSMFWLCLLLAGCMIFFRLDVPSRAVLLIFAVLAAVALSIHEWITIIYLRGKAKSGRLRENAILAGAPEDTGQFRASLSAEQLLEMNIVKEFNIEREATSSLVELLHKHSVSKVIFAGAHSHLNLLQEAITACETEGVEAWLMGDFIKTSIARPSFETFDNRLVMVFRATPAFSWAILAKTVIDKIGALIAIAITSPVMLLAVIGIKLTSSGPVIFRQMRGGKNGKPFVMYKFRTMCTDAEMRRDELEKFNQMSGPVFKIDRDPRVIPFGRWLRRTSIDELPQFINVLMGEMSLVGPRPLPLYEVEKFQHTAQRRRLSVKPGLTCLWQVSGRNEVKDFQEWVELDLEYIDNWSLWLDLGILLKTIPAVLFGTGAK
jgi:exopolysaccharide biosynthesis polyprenyl glycosylphosphotransferase